MAMVSKGHAVWDGAEPRRPSCSSRAARPSLQGTSPMAKRDLIKSLCEIRSPSTGSRGPAFRLDTLEPLVAWWGNLSYQLRAHDFH